jgi:hypothetical protein
MDKDFKIINPDWSRLWFQSYEVADVTMVDPDDETRVIQGEWVELAADSKMTRATAATVLHFPKVDIDGQYDVQAINSISVLQMGNFEVDTAIYDTGTLTALGDLVEIDVVSYAPGPNNRGIPTVWSADWSTGLLVGMVTKAPASGRIRFQTVCF